MHPLETIGSPDGACNGPHCANSLIERAFFQPPHPQLRRFIMVDQSGGKGRIFVHPSLAEELLSSSGQIVDPTVVKTERIEDHSRNPLLPTDVEEANAKLQAFRQTVATAFGSLQVLKDIRRDDAAAPWADVELSPTAPTTCSSCSSRTKRIFGSLSESGKEDTEDLDALLSSDDDDDEEEVTSAERSSDGQSTDDSYGIDGEGQGWKEREEDAMMEGGKQEGGRNGSKKSRQEEWTEEGDGGHEGAERKRKRFEKEGVARKLKIKRTVKTLRKMIPGGSCLDAALVLEETIFYVKILRERINQLEATRFPLPL